MRINLHYNRIKYTNNIKSIIQELNKKKVKKLISKNTVILFLNKNNEYLINLVKNTVVYRY